MSKEESTQTKSFCYADLQALREILPPKNGELLRQWMLRCTHLGLTTHKEAMQIKADNPVAWDSVYKLRKKSR